MTRFNLGACLRACPCPAVALAFVFGLTACGRPDVRVPDPQPDTVRLDVSDTTLQLGGGMTPELMGTLLRQVTDAIDEGAQIRLLPGRYVLAPVAFTDTACGNCEDASEDVPATYGLRITGRRVRLIGDHPDSVIIETNAGYGVLFEDCEACELVGVTITGGARDPDGRATDAAVVVRNSDVLMRDCVLRDNIGDSATVAAVTVGIAGIAGREGSHVDVENCRIERNSWDGIALYRGARARIHGNVIDGVDKARGAQVGGGRGVGIGLTWDAQADVVGNRVTRYWKGIGVFVDASATVRENVVEDVLTWGIAFWSAARGAPVARIDDNAVFMTGACAVMIAAEPPADDTTAARRPLGEPLSRAGGSLTGNAIARGAQDARYDSGEPYCEQAAIALEHVPPAFVVRGNLLYDNRHAGASAAPRQIARPAFEAAVAPLIERLRAWDATRDSRFVEEFGDD
ncbi:MAG TPA: right-handed parallel beta-helix repeat-containing protein [Longimicrobiales bacterium]